MKRTPLLAIAAAVAVAVPLLVFIASARNRGGEPEAEVELTERELRLVPLGEGRRWAALRLDWNGDLQWTQKDSGWFDGAKLAALGFDVRLPASDSRASGFYGWQPAREVFLALEVDGPAAAAADLAYPNDRASRSRLHPVDAALDARALRARFPDRHRVLVVRAVVAAECFSRWDRETRKASPPFLRGRIQRLLVEEIQVPRERRTLLDALARGEALPRGAGATSPVASAGGRPSGNVPRYSIVLRTGRRLEPWVAKVRPPGP
ncbi:MAG TPA: DUF4824 family protein [Thermoanaerobaculia bacterium]|nr:DUF4824 family protein [Thermoanaerobaculia bacterium]